MLAQQVIHRHRHVRHQHPAGAQAVAVHVAHITAQCVQEPMHLALRMMETPGAGPAVRTAEDRRIAVGRDDAAQFAGDHIDRMVPVDLDERLAAAAHARITPPGRVRIEPAGAHRRALHPDRRLVGLPHRRADRGRIGIAGVRPQADGAIPVAQHFVGAPVRGGQFTVDGPGFHGDNSACSCIQRYPRNDRPGSDRRLPAVWRAVSFEENLQCAARPPMTVRRFREP